MPIHAELTDSLFVQAEEEYARLLTMSVVDRPRRDTVAEIIRVAVEILVANGPLVRALVADGRRGHGPRRGDRPDRRHDRALDQRGGAGRPTRHCPRSSAGARHPKLIARAWRCGAMRFASTGQPTEANPSPCTHTPPPRRGGKVHSRRFRGSNTGAAPAQSQVAQAASPGPAPMRCAAAYRALSVAGTPLRLGSTRSSLVQPVQPRCFSNSISRRVGGAASNASASSNSTRDGSKPPPT